MLRQNFPAGLLGSTGPSPASVDGSEHYLAITLPSREHKSYPAVLELLKRFAFIAEPSNGKWWLRDRHKTLNFLAAYAERFRGEFGASFTANFGKNTSHFRPAEIVCTAEPAGKEFEVTLSLRAGVASEAEMRSALISGRSYLEAGGQVILLDPAKVQKLGDAQRALAGSSAGGVLTRSRQRISGTRVAEIDALIEPLASGFQPPAEWRARSEALRNLSTLKPAPLSPEFDAKLRPYQRIGAAWLWHIHRNELGAILADEMGLGKTVQALALLCAARDPAAEHAASLVVCPASLLENWRREAAKFAPGLRTFVHHGDRRLSDPAEFRNHDLIVTSYGTLVRDEGVFSGCDFKCVIADEAQHIKNRQSQNARALRTLKARSRFVLTGTPVENSLDDLRSLFEFLLPGYLERVPAGRNSEKAWLDQRLRVQAAPYILRRTKGAVAPELPAKIEQTIWCELTGAQAALYREAQERAERDLIDLAAGGASEGRLRVATLTQLLRLRQICCDPRLAGGTSSPAQKGAVPAGSAAAPYADSTKLEALRELLEESLDDGHRVLVFSQFTSLLALLKEDLSSQGLGYCYLDGSMPVGARQAEVDRFQSSREIPVFLLSLKAGGSGLNLTGADTVVHFDPWWNPAVEMQATDRAHRIGQTRVVTSYKLIASGTVEEKVLGLQAEKRTLLKDVFEASDVAAARLSLADLRSLLASE
jgi:SNF2 family DNA or RNA helicase